MTTIRGALRSVVDYRVDEDRCFWFVLSGDSGRRRGALLARIEWALPACQEIGIIFARR